MSDICYILAIHYFTRDGDIARHIYFSFALYGYADYYYYMVHIFAHFPSSLFEAIIMFILYSIYRFIVTILIHRRSSWLPLLHISFFLHMFHMAMIREMSPFTYILYILIYLNNYIHHYLHTTLSAMLAMLGVGSAAC